MTDAAVNIFLGNKKFILAFMQFHQKTAKDAKEMEKIGALSPIVGQ